MRKLNGDYGTAAKAVPWSPRHLQAAADAANLHGNRYGCCVTHVLARS